MDFRLSAEDRDLQVVVREFLAAKSPESAVRAAADAGRHDAGLWSAMGELGLQGIAVPSRYGGAGYGFVQLGVVLEELGAALAVTPFLGSCVLAAELLLGLDDHAACEQYLPGIASGELVAAVALAGDAGSWEAGATAITAWRDGGGWVLSGHSSYVIDGSAADVLMVVAELPAENDVGVFAVAANEVGVARETLESWDRTRDLARVVLDKVPAVHLGEPSATRPALRRMLDHAAIALAADSVGGMARTLESAVSYAKTREQFGRPIGSFQAVKHKCASVLVDLEGARSAVLYATWAASVLSDDVPRVASLAKAFCADAYVDAAIENIQIHGGIGFTWEHSAHLYLKRAKANEALLGSSYVHRQRVADYLGLGAPADTH